MATSTTTKESGAPHFPDLEAERILRDVYDLKRSGHPRDHIQAFLLGTRTPAKLAEALVTIGLDFNWKRP